MQPKEISYYVKFYKQPQEEWSRQQKLQLGKHTGASAFPNCLK